MYLLKMGIHRAVFFFLSIILVTGYKQLSLCCPPKAVLQHAGIQRRNQSPKIPVVQMSRPCGGVNFPVFHFLTIGRHPLMQSTEELAYRLRSRRPMI